MSYKWQYKLRNRMASHEEPAPTGLWEGIEKRMVSESIISEMRDSGAISRKRRLWEISIGAVAAAVVLLFFVLNLPENNQINESVSKSDQTTLEYADKSVSNINTEIGKSSVNPFIETTKEVDVAEIKTAENKIRTLDPQIYESEISKVQTLLEVDTKNLGNNTADTKIDIVDSKIENRESSIIKDDMLFASSNNVNSRKNSRWQTNVSMSNAPSGSMETYSGYGTLALEKTVDRQYAFGSQYTREEAYTDVKHLQPVTFGLTLKYNLSDRWSLASGLTYSLLSSKLRAESSNYFYDDTQTLHYLGIPLNVGYTFWENDKILTYISAGGLVEKNIAGKLTSNYYIDDEFEMTTSKKVTSKQLQWSVNSAIGIEYRFSDLIGIYAEPGVVYYFNNGSALENIYKDRPINFNLRLGLRFTFAD